MPTINRPNILWVSFEDTNPFYGCYGDRVARTPNVDRLAAEGCRWPLAFSTAGVCAPARCAVITGMYAISVGGHHMRTTHTNRFTPAMPTPYSAVIPHYAKCFSEYLRAAGYYCTNNAKTDYQFHCPCTAWDDCSTTAHWRNRPDKDQPFFAVFNMGVSHESGMWPEKCPEITFDPASMTLPPYFPDTPKVREAMARMYTNIQKSDRGLGQLSQQLEEDGLLENTIVMHWSDHGPLPRGKRWPYDSGIRIPMIVRWPGHLHGGSVSEQLVSTIDLAPTVLSLCGLPIPRHMQGTAFLGEQAGPPRQYIFASRDRHDEAYDMVRAARDIRFKYIRNFRPELPYSLWIPYLNNHPIMQEMWRVHMEGKDIEAQRLMFQSSRPPEELYDTQVDPWEIHNLAGEAKYATDLDRLRQAMEGWRHQVGDLGEIPEAEMVRGWYPDGRQPTTSAAIVVPICQDSPGMEAVQGGQFRQPVLFQLHSATQGASLTYTLEEGEAARWLLYTEPLRLPPGRHTLRARAIRIGYKESDETTMQLEVV